MTASNYSPYIIYHALFNLLRLLINALKIQKMKLRFTGLALTIILLAACQQRENPVAKHSDTDNLIEYDSILANKLGADKYGMKSYVMAFLKRGPNRSRDSATATHLQRAHLDNIQRMADEGMLVLAGPFLDTGDVRGIYIFNVSTIEEAKKLTESDPAIKAGSLEMELHPWYGSAALMRINDIHKKLSKNPI